MQPTLYLDIPVIGVTGSFGKTTAKEVIADVLSVKYNTYRSPKNFNMVDQTKKNVKNINEEHEAVVFEMAMSKKGRGRRQCTVIQPNIGVITAIGHAHFERFSSISDVVASKSEMMKYMHPEGILYLNYDDENCQAVDTQYFTGEIVTVGLNEGSDYRATNIKFKNSGMEFDVNIQGQQEHMFLPLLGEHSVRNALFAIAIADQLKLTPAEIREGLTRVKLPRGRLTLDNLEGKRTLIDDSYNANPVSMLSGLKVLDEYMDHTTKIALLGDMAELGSYSKEGHKKVGKNLSNFNVDKVYLYGENSRWIKEAAEEAGFSEDKLFHFTDLESLKETIEKEFIEDTAVFVKASNSTKLGRVVKHLLNRFEQDKEKTSL